MKRSCPKAVLIILVIWFFIFMVDVICAFTIKRPVFMIAHIGGCNTQYIGLGYGIAHSYNMTPEGTVSESFRVQPYIYLLVNMIFIARLIISKLGSRVCRKS